MTIGSNVKWYADRMGWNLLRRNIMVEGDRDVRYFKLAARLYSNSCNRSLLGKDLSIMSAGTGDKGGTYGVFEEFPTLVKLIQTDCDPNGKSLFKVVALLDNDHAGRTLMKTVVGQYRSMKQNRDIFLLNWVFPRSSSEPGVLSRQLESFNVDWKNLDCEIEDMLSKSLLEAFIDEMPNSLAGPFKEISGHRHYDWTGNGKAHLVLFAEKHAMLEDVTGIIEILKSFRFYLGLEHDGVP